MKESSLSRSGASPETVDLLLRLVELIPWPIRRAAMGDITLTLLDGKHRVAEDVFGWNRKTTQLGVNEYRTGITCINDLSSRQKQKSEVKHPQLMKDIEEIMDIHSQAESHLRTTLLYTNMTAQSVYNALLEKGWTSESLPKVRSISNILNRNGYRLRTVAKTKVQKKRKRPTQSLQMSTE